MFFVNLIRSLGVHLFWLILPLGVLVLAGCERLGEADTPVSGQVFLVLPSGENLRLGSVRMQVFEVEAIRAHLAVREGEVNARQNELRENLVNLEAEGRASVDRRAEAEAAYEEREAEIRAELRVYIDEMEARRDRLREQVESNLAFIDSVDQLPQPPPGIPTRAEFEAYEERRTKWLSMSREERRSWGAALASMNRDLGAEIEKMEAAREEKVFAMADELQALDEAIIQHDRAAEAALETARRIRGQLDGFPTYADFLQELPAPLTQVWTDANGEFQVTLPSGRGYVLFAETERPFGGESRKFQWFVEIGSPSPAGGRVILSNHNLVTSGASENVIVLPVADDNVGA